MKIVLDSNILIPNYCLSGTHYPLLKKLVAMTQSNLVIPRIVLEEVVNKYKKHLTEKYENHLETYKKINNCFPLGNPLQEPLLDIENETEKYKLFLENELSKFNTEYPDYSEIPHENIVARAIAKRKPFDEKSDKGYRDSLIWETLLKILKNYNNEDIIFVTANTKDFFNEEKEGLHGDLIKDLSTIGVESDKIKVYSSLKDFIDEYVIDKLDSLEEEVLAQLESDSYKNFSILYFLRKHSDEITQLIEPHLEELISSLGLDDPAPTIDYLENSDSLEVFELAKLDDNTIFMEFSVKYCINVSFFIFKPDYYALGDEQEEYFSIEDYDWSDHYVLASTYLESTATFSMNFNLEEKTVEAYELENIELDNMSAA